MPARRGERVIGCGALLGLGVALAACGNQPAALRHPVPGPGTPGTVLAAHPTRRDLALRDAESLIGRVELPPGSHAVSRPPAGAKALAQPALRIAALHYVMVHRFAVVDESPSSVLAWFKSHVPAGSTASGNGQSGRWGTVTSWFDTFSWPTPGRFFRDRAAEVEIAPLRGAPDRAAVRVDAQVVYAPRRPATDRIAAGAAVLTATLAPQMNPGEPGGAAATTSNPREIAAIERWVNHALPVANVTISCPLDTGGILTLQFRRSAHAAPYATVTADSTGCELLTIAHGKVVEKPGLEGGGFVSFVERELGMHPKPVKG